jgi:hypothetical protein
MVGLTVSFSAFCVRDGYAQSGSVNPDKIYLMLTVVMAKHLPDIHYQLEEESMDECWVDAKAFINHGVPKQIEGAKAVVAGCLTDRPSDQGT